MRIILAVTLSVARNSDFFDLFDIETWARGSQGCLQSYLKPKKLFLVEYLGLVLPKYLSHVVDRARVADAANFVARRYQMRHHRTSPSTVTTELLLLFQSCGLFVSVVEWLCRVD
jgi:hypothetical protein